MSHQVYSLGKLYSSFISIARLKLWSHEVLASASTLVSMLGNEFDADARRGLYGCKSMWAITSINSGDRCGQTLTVAQCTVYEIALSSLLPLIFWTVGFTFKSFYFM